MTHTPFQELETFTDKDVADAIARNNPEELLHVPIAVSMEHPNFEWAEEICLRLASHSDATVRGNSILGLGHLARRFNRLSHQARWRVRDALHDKDPHVRAQAESASQDIKHFIKASNPG